MTSELLNETVALLEKDKGSWPKTANETGLGREWLAKLSHGGIDDPGVKKIERLHNYLAEKYRAAQLVTQS